MSLTLRLAPDPVLRAVCKPVDPALAALAKGMLEVMYRAQGRGLAAPQVGVMKRIFVMDATWKDGAPDPQIFVNPVVSWADERCEASEEGCLSIPDTPCMVTRPVAIRLTWQDLEGAPHEAAFDGFAARCIQHERDHLDGILCTDYAI
ncbi:peptide deformylase [Yoonia sp. R2331]|uniref:peptide deformylase n=1 Tax=Yoonia sp. R2331 TaxID=3237238 RepID=UPI0034E59348